MRCNFDFWRYSILLLDLRHSNSLIVSKQSIMNIRSNKPNLLSNVIVEDSHSYRFIRMDPYINPNKTLLRYIICGNMSSVMVRVGRKINRKRLIKMKPLSYNLRKNGRLKEEQILRIKECDKILQLL
jgi:hypothetical protein